MVKGNKRDQIIRLLRRIDPSFSAPPDARFVTAEFRGDGAQFAERIVVPDSRRIETLRVIPL